MSNFVNVVVTDNAQVDYIEVRFERNEANSYDQLNVIACFSYEKYEQITDLCDDQVLHSLINIQGYCFLDFEVTIDEAKAATLTKNTSSYQINGQPSQLADLA